MTWPFACRFVDLTHRVWQTYPMLLNATQYHRKSPPFFLKPYKDSWSVSPCTLPSHPLFSSSGTCISISCLIKRINKVISWEKRHRLLRESQDDAIGGFSHFPTNCNTSIILECWRRETRTHLPPGRSWFRSVCSNIAMGIPTFLERPATSTFFPTVSIPAQTYFKVGW